jgi:hypothetical protein
MKDDHLTLRIPRDLARALARLARERAVPKSQIAREAVVRYLAPGGATAPPWPVVRAADLAARWERLPRLTPEEAADYAEDLAGARRALPDVRAPWA